MNIVLHTHPDFLGSQSHLNLARALADGYRSRGHTVSLRQPVALVHRLVPRGRLSKWAGYIDQYLVFPRQMRAAMRGDPARTLYAFCDQALGPWIKHVAHRPHVVHCMDLLALRSALGDIVGQRTSLTGRVYQRYIRSGFRAARHFISISQQSRDDLHRFGGVAPVISEVVYLGLNYPYRPVAPEAALHTLVHAGLPADARRCVLHVGGGQWYKNAVGVVRLYGAYAQQSLREGRQPLPLWMVSPPPNAALQAALAQLPDGAAVQFVKGLDHPTLQALYAHAEVLLFPSLAEGFGWPIVEAMACACPVITTGEPPMTEVGGDAAVYLPRPDSTADMTAWAQAGARVLWQILQRTPAQRAVAAATGLAHAARFNADSAIDQTLAIYQRVLALDDTTTSGGSK